MDKDLEFDRSHPIPDVTVLDTTIGLNGGGVSFGLAIAYPLRKDSRSLKRLRVKIENYVDHFFSDEGAAQFGTPKSGLMEIAVHIHRDSDPEVFAQLEAYATQIRSRGIEFHLKKIDTPV